MELKQTLQILSPKRSLFLTICAVNYPCSQVRLSGCSAAFLPTTLPVGSGGARTAITASQYQAPVAGEMRIHVAPRGCAMKHAIGIAGTLFLPLQVVTPIFTNVGHKLSAAHLGYFSRSC